MYLARHKGTADRNGAATRKRFAFLRSTIPEGRRRIHRYAEHANVQADIKEIPIFSTYRIGDA